MPLETIVQWVESSKYILLFLGCLFEGPVAMVAGGFLYKLGVVELVPVYAVLMAGDLVADISWYFIGRFAGRPFISKWGHFFGVTEEAVTRIQGRFHKYQERILIISKLTTGFGFAVVTLVVAGMLHVPFKRYVMLNLLGGFIWVAFLITVGYFFGNIYESITGPEKLIFIGVALCGIIFVLRFVKKYLLAKEI